MRNWCNFFANIDSEALCTRFYKANDEYSNDTLINQGMVVTGFKLL